MNGTITGTVNVYSRTGQNVWQARSGDRVQITNGLLYGLQRNGTPKLSGFYIVDLDFVKMDTPPVEPPIETEYILHVKNGVQRKFVLSK